MAETIASKVGFAAMLARAQIEGIPFQPGEIEKMDKWGKAIIEHLTKKGIYINQARNDPSGRW